MYSPTLYNRSWDLICIILSLPSLPSRLSSGFPGYWFCLILFPCTINCFYSPYYTLEICSSMDTSPCKPIPEFILDKISSPRTVTTCAPENRGMLTVPVLLIPNFVYIPLVYLCLSFLLPVFFNVGFSTDWELQDFQMVPELAPYNACPSAPEGIFLALLIQFTVVPISKGEMHTTTIYATECRCQL